MGSEVGAGVVGGWTAALTRKIRIIKSSWEEMPSNLRQERLRKGQPCKPGGRSIPREGTKVNVQGKKSTWYHNNTTTLKNIVQNHNSKQLLYPLPIIWGSLCAWDCSFISQTTYKTLHLQKLMPPEVSYRLKVMWSSDFMSEIWTQVQSLNSKALSST